MKSPKIIALVQVLGLVAYIAIFASFVNTLPEVLGLEYLNQIFKMMIFLLVFILSALISGSLILGYPIVIFSRGRRDEAIKIVIWSMAWIITALIVFLGVVIFL